MLWTCYYHSTSNCLIINYQTATLLISSLIFKAFRIPDSSRALTSLSIQVHSNDSMLHYIRITIFSDLYRCTVYRVHSYQQHCMQQCKTRIFKYINIQKFSVTSFTRLLQKLNFIYRNSNKSKIEKLNFQLENFEFHYLDSILWYNR